MWERERLILLRPLSSHATERGGTAGVSHRHDALPIKARKRSTMLVVRFQSCIAPQSADTGHHGVEADSKGSVSVTCGFPSPVARALR